MISLSNTLNKEFDIRNLKVSQKTQTTVILSWDAISEATSYEVFYGNQKVITEEPTISIINLKPQTAYIFKVRALKESSMGAWSNELTVTTNSPDTFKSGEMTLKLEKDQEYTLVFNGNYLKDLENKIFIISYDASSLSFVDFMINAEGLEVIENSTGEIKIKLNKEGLKQLTWSGLMTSVKFKALATKETTIIFKLLKKLFYQRFWKKINQLKICMTKYHQKMN